jgi:gliding motility-associated-like protein
VNFSNGSSNATSYEWAFGDGNNSTSAAPTHVYTTVGTYMARLIAINPNACKVRDTVFIAINVDTNRADANFTAQVLDSCGPYRVNFVNTSQYSNTPGAQGFTRFLWLFGDGGSSTAVNPGVHAYADTGTYNVLLIMRDSTACNSPDTMRRTIRINGFRVRAGFNAPSGCITSSLGFVSTSTNASSLLWRFGDGTTGNTASPIHTYAVAGTYTVTLIASNGGSCNKADSVTQTVQVKASPIADFYFEPVIPEPNMPIQFFNTSVNAVSYFWGFGDGTNSVDLSPSHLFKRTGTYEVCLTATSADGCVDMICKNVDADIHAAADVPTAFSPNGDGSNDILYVRGAAMETLDFRVYNRWGELVFQTTNQEVGWDGTYKGKPAEVDAYAFVLSVSFIDGKSLQKTGNVTLLR